MLAMMDSFVEAQNSLKRMGDGGVTLFKTRQSHAVRFSFIPVVMKSPGLKPIEAQNARSSSACVDSLQSWIGHGRREIATAIIDQLPKFGSDSIIHIRNLFFQRGSEFTVTIWRV
jgi:hypothetical protein